MAHHNSTPQSVLDAPVLTPVVFSGQRGFSRAERRHGINAPAKSRPGAFEKGIAEAKAWGKNIPFSWADDERTPEERAETSLAQRIRRQMNLVEQFKQKRSRS